MTTIEILVKALDKIKLEANWGKGCYARDAAGIAVFATDPSACQWCARGAITAVCLSVEIEVRAARALAAFVGGPIYEFNDHPATTHADVVAAFEYAIEEERASQP